MKFQKQCDSSSPRYCTSNKMSKPIEEKGKKKNIKLSIPHGPQRWAFYQAFQPSVNYSRQRRRTRTLSAITLHSSLPSVSNINVMAFIFSSRLWTREASLKSALSHFLLSVNKWHLNKKNTCALVSDAWSGHLKQLFKKHAGINASLCTFWWWGCGCSWYHTIGSLRFYITCGI